MQMALAHCILGLLRTACERFWTPHVYGFGMLRVDLSSSNGVGKQRGTIKSQQSGNEMEYTMSNASSLENAQEKVLCTLKAPKG